MTPSELIKTELPAIVAKYARRSDARAAVQVLNTGLPFLALIYLALHSHAVSGVLSAACSILAALFMLRIFIVMHECGHRSFFRTQILNQVFGFIAGVLCGMPQHVWSKNHNHHHATNGNWERYTGPLGTITVDAFARLSPWGQRRYQIVRNVFFAVPGAFVYFVVNPRLNWLLGTFGFLRHVVVTKLRQPRTPLIGIARDFKSPYWKCSLEYWHMAGNNVLLLGIWWYASDHFGAAAFLTVYLTSLVLGGAAGIVIFTAQHNFESSYASGDSGWDYHQAAEEGTSFLKLPGILNWFSADIAYHHIHHLSARIPNYRLAACHEEYAHLFDQVKRISLRDLGHNLKFILWDPKQRRIVSVAQFRQMQEVAADLEPAEAV